jgi:5-methylcytosine-specific restriction endonuclease McrA
MTWFKVDDTFHAHPKVLATDPAALGLWVVAGSWSAANLTEGHIPDHVLVRLVPGATRLAAKLESAGLWRRNGTGYEFHQWGERNPSAEAVRTQRAKNARRSALHRNPDLLLAVRMRDDGMCRYCGQRVKWQDRRSELGGTYDHIDPDGPNEIDNLVVACRGCNSRKRDRTPAQAGMTLLPEPKTDLLRTKSAARSYALPDPTRPVPSPTEKKGRGHGASADAPSPPTQDQRPAWCGQCDQATRMIEVPDGRLTHCPTCHPLVLAALALEPR